MKLIKGYAMPPGADRVDYGGLVSLGRFGANTPVSTPSAYPHTPSADPRMRQFAPPVIGQAQPGSLPYSAQVYAQAVRDGVAPDPYAAVPAMHGFGDFGAPRGVVSLEGMTSLALGAWFGTSEQSSDSDEAPQTSVDPSSVDTAGGIVTSADSQAAQAAAGALATAAIASQPGGADLLANNTSMNANSSNTPLILAGVAVVGLLLITMSKGSGRSRRSRSR